MSRGYNDFGTETSEFIQIKAYLPRSLYEFLRGKAAEQKQPMSKMVAIAIDNEMDAPAPFNYPVLIPSNTFVENAYLEEAQRIVRYLEGFPKGVARDSLVLARRDMEIPSRETFMLALRELFHAKVICEVDPPRKVHFSYPKGYKYIRLVNITRDSALSRKKRMAEQLKKEIEAEERAMAEKKEKFGVRDSDDK